jgi:acyl-CoA thioesterase
MGSEEYASVPHPYGDLLGIEVIEMADGHSLARIEITPRLHNPNGVVHGGALFSLADSSMGAAMRTLFDIDKHYFSTIEVQIRFLRSVSEGTVTVETNVAHAGKRVVHLASELKNHQGDVVATATGSFAVRERRSKKRSSS